MADFENYSPQYTLRIKSVTLVRGECERGCQSGNWQLKTAFSVAANSPLCSIVNDFWLSNFGNGYCT